MLKNKSNKEYLSYDILKKWINTHGINKTKLRLKKIKSKSTKKYFNSLLKYIIKEKNEQN